MSSPPAGIEDCFKPFWDLARSGGASLRCGHKLDPHRLWFYCGNDSWNLTRLAHWHAVLPAQVVFLPLLMALMPIPTLALLPLILILFGIGEISKVVTIAGSVFFPVVINTAAGVANIDSSYLDVAKNYGAGPKDFFLKIALPGALPVMMEGIQMGQAIALLTIVAAEMIGAQSGIGYLIWSSYKVFNFNPMYVGLILISFFGYIPSSILLRWLQHKLVPWQEHR